MILIHPDTININEIKIKNIDSQTKAIYRKIIFCKKTSSKALMDAFISNTNDLAELLSIKNAQMESQNEDEAKLYLKNLRKAVLFVMNEIKNETPFENQVQLFQLFRLISPESYKLHPNRYRDTLVQIGGHICPESNEIPGLISLLFYNLTLIPHPIIRAIYLHHELIRIHPFVDGNGRTIRVAKNWILMHNLYPPIFIRDEYEKEKYIDSLSKSFSSIEKNNEIWNEETNKFFEQELDRLLDNTLLILDNLNKISQLDN